MRHRCRLGSHRATYEIMPYISFSRRLRYNGRPSSRNGPARPTANKLACMIATQSMRWPLFCRAVHYVAGRCVMIEGRLARFEWYDDLFIHTQCVIRCEQTSASCRLLTADRTLQTLLYELLLFCSSQRSTDKSINEIDRSVLFVLFIESVEYTQQAEHIELVARVRTHELTCMKCM